MAGYANQKDMKEGRDEALLSGDVEQLRRYMIRAEVPGAETADARVLEISLHKARVHLRTCPPDKLYESVWWLHDHNFKLDW